MAKVIVKPISKKAKNRFSNLMNNNGQCIVEQKKDNKLFLTSINNRNHFWILINNDPDWIIE